MSLHLILATDDLENVDQGQNLQNSHFEARKFLTTPNNFAQFSAFSR